MTLGNTFEEAPVEHTAKFLWLFALLPLIGQAMELAMPPGSSGTRDFWARYLGFVVAAVIVGIGVGVYRCSLRVAQVGFALFSLAALGTLGAALFAENSQAAAVLVVLPTWGAIKLYKVCGVLAAPSGP